MQIYLTLQHCVRVTLLLSAHMCFYFGKYSTDVHLQVMQLFDERKAECVTASNMSHVLELLNKIHLTAKAQLFPLQERLTILLLHNFHVLLLDYLQKMLNACVI